MMGTCDCEDVVEVFLPHLEVGLQSKLPARLALMLCEEMSLWMVTVKKL